MLTAPEIAAADIEAAAADARQAALAVGVLVRPPESDSDLRALIAVGEAVWGMGGTLAPNELRALVHAGGVVLGAWEAHDDLAAPVGFLLGFLGWRDGLHLHSHQTGVLPGHHGRGVGYALKLAQREICLRHGVAEVRWTFDPMIRRNTSFNISKLGAAAVRFLPEFYGRMDDTINSDDLSDRLEAVWTLTAPLPGTGPTRARPAAERPALRALVARDGWPEVIDTPPSAGNHLAVPEDFATLRHSDPPRARAWRLAVRSVLETGYASGLRIVDVDVDGYVFGASAVCRG